MSTSLTLKQQGFINAYTDSSNGITYGNRTQAVKEVYGYTDDNTAAVMGSKLVSNGKIKSKLDTIIEESNLGAKVRINTIAEIVHGNYLQTTTTTSTDKDGNEYHSSTSKGPTSRDRLQAIDLLSKIDGTYDKNKVKADVMSADLKSLIKEHRKSLK